MLPFDYAIRNLGRSPIRLIISVLGSTLVVMLVIAAVSFVRGMEQSLRQSGSARNVILLGAGSEESIERSEVSPAVPGQVIASVAGIQNHANVPFVSGEVHMALDVEVGYESGIGQRGQTQQVQRGQALFRGVTEAAFMVHEQVTIVDGRTFSPGQDEIIVGSLAATRLGVPEDQLAVGKSIRVDGRQWKIVGRFSAPNTVMDAEIWCPLANLQIVTRRDSLSCVVLTLGQGDFSDVEIFVASRLDLELIAIREVEYYQSLVEFYRPLRVMVWVTACLIGLGGLFGGLNTMYAAFVSRVREIGMLQTLGYSRLAVVVSFVQESVVATAAGGLIGCALSLVMFGDLSVKFSMGAFGLIVDSFSIATGLVAAIVLGVVGCLPPAWQCIRLPISESLKAA